MASLWFNTHANPIAINAYNNNWCAKSLAKEKSLDLTHFTLEGWEEFIRKGWGGLLVPEHKEVNETIVKEFYAMLDALCRYQPNNEDITHVCVRGMYVPWTAQAINRAFGLQEDYSVNKSYNELWGKISGEVFQSACYQWQLDSLPRGYENLKETEKALKKFLANRVMYSENPKKIEPEEVYLLFAITQLETVNWGKIIREHLLGLMRQSSFPKNIPYGYLISRLAVVFAGVQVNPTDVVSQADF